MLDRSTSALASLCVLVLATACGGDASSADEASSPEGGGSPAAGQSGGPGGASGAAGRGGAAGGTGGSGASSGSKAGGSAGSGNTSGAGESGTGGGGSSSGASGQGGAEPGGSAGTSDAGGAAGKGGAGGKGGAAGKDGAGGKGGTAGKGGSAGGGPAACTTRITYGDRWEHAPDHPQSFDEVEGKVSWDGNCTVDGASTFTVLSNGWKPYFSGHEGCVMALDTTCAGAPACTTRVTYGPAWGHPAGHPAQYDDVAGRVYWDGRCDNVSGGSAATLSNGWAPHFTAAKACEVSFTYEQCGGLYENPVFPSGCADPGVLHDGDSYVLVCTSGGAADAFPIRVSTDLVHWSPKGHIFPAGSKPSWATGDFWAPEIHHVDSHYVAYFSARHKDGRLSIGAATSKSPLGPFTDIGKPLVHDASMGMIDVTEFEDDAGNPYLVWKEDGNAVGQHTPIFGQPLAPGGTALTGARKTLITNDLGWEGGVVEGPWVTKQGGHYFLFYSGNSYANSTYAVGVARATSPLGPYAKAGDPIVKTNGSWVGPGHCSVVDGPSGDTYMVYHAWHPGQVNGPGDERVPLVDRVSWGDWPAVPESPSISSRPMP